MTKPEQQQQLPFRNRFASNNPREHYSAEQLAFLKKKESARQASRHSTGPSTPEGKRIAAQNARKHGYAGATMAISDEDRPAYQAHVESYIQAFQPQNQPQADAVRLAANALWRTDRLTTIEASLLELEIDTSPPPSATSIAPSPPLKNSRNSPPPFPSPNRKQTRNPKNTRTKPSRSNRIQTN